MNTTLSQYANLATSFSEEQSNYAIKPTKASSKRLRSLSQQMSNLGTSLRAELVAADKSK